AERLHLLREELRLERRQPALENGTDEERAEGEPAATPQRPAREQDEEVDQGQPAGLEHLEVEDAGPLVGGAVEQVGEVVVAVVPAEREGGAQEDAPELLLEGGERRLQPLADEAA